MGEIFCACKFPRGVNKCDTRYHCDRCGYQLGVEDRRRRVLLRVGLEIWSIFVLRVEGYRRPDHAWNFIERQLGISDAYRSVRR